MSSPASSAARARVLSVNVVDELTENSDPDADWITACISVAKAVQG